MSDFDELSRRAWERNRLRRRETRSSDRRTTTSQLAAVDDIEQQDEGKRFVNPEWRRERLIRNRGRRSTTAFYSSPQQLQIWLQKNKWIFVALAGIAVLFVALLIYSLQQTRGVRSSNPFMINATTTVSTEGGTSSIQPQATIIIEPPTPVQSPTMFEVVNTDGQGLFLRAEPSTSSSPLATLPEGTRLEQVGDDEVKADFIWRYVRAPGGQQGWVAVDFLKAVQ